PPARPSSIIHSQLGPDITTGSYVLLNKNTCAQMALVDQAGQQVKISQVVVSITNVPLSPEVQKLITDVFTIKFTDNVNPKIQFTLGTSGNNLADIGTFAARGNADFDLKMPGIGEGTVSPV